MPLIRGATVVQETNTGICDTFLRDDTIPFSEYLLTKGPGNVPLSTTYGYYTSIFFLIWGVCVCGGGMCMWALWGQRHQIPWYLSHRWLWDAWCRDWELNSKLWENSMYFTRRDIRIGLISVLIKFHHFNAWAIYSRPRSSWIQALTSVSLIFLRASCHRVYS